jgi:hypothetical protein
VIRRLGGADRLTAEGGCATCFGERTRESLDDEMIDHDALAVAEREGADAVSIEELREMLKCIPGSMSDAIISERGDY